MTTVKEGLLAALAADGRAPVERIARTLGHSSATVRRALSDLESDGLAVRGIVHPFVLGLRSCAHLLVSVSGSPASVVDRLAERVEVPFVSLLAGAHQVAAEVRVRDRDELAGTVRDIASMTGVADVAVHEYVDILKDVVVQPERPTPLVLDDIDHQILASLQDDGRRTFAALGEQVGLTTASTRVRALRLIDAGAVRIGIRRKPGPGTVQVGFRLSSPATQAQWDGQCDQVCQREDVTFLATSYGSADLVGTLTCASAGAAAEALAGLATLPHARSLSSWTHLTVVKERYAEDGLATLQQGQSRLDQEGS